MDERHFRIPSGCGVSGIMARNGMPLGGDRILTSICNMMERGNGLGSGFAAYGIYPDFKDYWCFHIMYNETKGIETTENYLEQKFHIIHSEPIPTKRVRSLFYTPRLHRYFLKVQEKTLEKEIYSLTEEDFIIKTVMFINKNIKDSFVFSSGKNMGIFKGVGQPDEIGEFYKILDYKGYIWLSHNRFPTNTVAWWGGAHPFGILDWSVVHNGEISSYGINRRYLENSGYFCTLFTDTEVITYLFDLLYRKHKHDFQTIGDILAPPFWFQIERVEDENCRRILKSLRIVYASALVNGPFGVIVANSESMVGMTDRIKLRPLVAGEDDEFYYIASEEAAIRIIGGPTKNIFQVEAGKPVIFKVKWQR